MEFLSLLSVAVVPILQVLLIGVIGAYLASGYSGILTAIARKDMNKVVFHVFTPALMFVSLAKTVTLDDVISWWFMPVNIFIVYVIGGVLGWLAAKLLNLPEYLQPVMIAFCSAGNFGNLLLVIVPAICEQNENPFKEPDASICRSRGLSYSSLSMALGGFFIWTHTYCTMKKAGKIYHRTLQLDATGNENKESPVVRDPEAIIPERGVNIIVSDDGEIRHVEKENELNVPLLPNENGDAEVAEQGALQQFLEELLAPPTISAIMGLVVGTTKLRSLIIGENAPLHFIQETLQLLGDGTIPVITLILGGNLTQGFQRSRLRRLAIVAIICIRFLLLPLIGIGVVKVAYQFGFLYHDPLYQYVLLLQFAVPPAMNIATMAQLFDVAHEESSVIFFWTYIVSAVALTGWSTVFLYVLP